MSKFPRRWGEHSRVLDELIWNLTSVKEDPDQVHWIMKDGVWMPHAGSHKRSMLCDLILVYHKPHDPEYTCLELKHSKRGKNRAVMQLESSENFIRKIIDPSTNKYIVRKKIVYYRGGGFTHEQVDE